MSIGTESQNNSGKNMLSSFLGTGKMDVTGKAPGASGNVAHQQQQHQLQQQQAPAAPRVIPSSRQAAPVTAIPVATSAIEAKAAQTQLETYMSMAAEMQTLLKQERQKSQQLYQEMRRVQEYYQNFGTQKEQQIQTLVAEKQAAATAYQEAQNQVAEHAAQLAKFKQELAKVGKNWDTIKKLAEAKEQFEQLLTKYSDSEVKFQSLFDNSAQSIRKVDEILREVQRRFALMESTWSIESKQRKQGDTDLKTSTDRIAAEVEGISGALHSVHQHMGQYELAIHSIIGQIEKRDRANHELHKTLKIARDSQDRAEQAIDRIETRQANVPRAPSRAQVVRLIRKIASPVTLAFAEIETMIQGAIKVTAKAVQIDAVLRRLDLLQGQSEVSQSALQRIEKQSQEIATTVAESFANRLIQNQLQVQGQIIERVMSSEAQVIQSNDRIRRELEGLKAENELFRSVLLRWMDENRVSVAAAAAPVVSAEPAQTSTSKAVSPLVELMAIKENKIQKLREELKATSTEASRKQLQLILDATIMQRDQISKILAR